MKLQHQKLWVLSIAALTILSSVFATLWANGFFLSYGPRREHYQNITFTDAVLKCESTTRARYNHLLQNLAMDDLSSRLDHGANLYRIFFIAEIAESLRDSARVDIYISCLVNAENGLVTEYEALQKREPTSEPIRKDKGGIFGWPLK